MAQLTQERVAVGERSVVAMSRPASTIAAEAMLDEALQRLLDAGSKYLVVVASGGRIVGVLGGRQLAAAWADRAAAFPAIPVTAVLDAAPPIVTSTATVLTAARLIRDYGSEVVVIVAPGGAPVRLVTADDLLDGIAASG